MIGITIRMLSKNLFIFNFFFWQSDAISSIKMFFTHLFLPKIKGGQSIHYKPLEKGGVVHYTFEKMNKLIDINNYIW
ncbi:MAG: hypothetical protein A2W19_16255 [Spirochaetes bacterium RBG_16_49_21]|nr:MAG: hypothetical protein A2W19_16255 [Spirochaetes bacterium RBG_16_49_21]